MFFGILQDLRHVSLLEGFLKPFVPFIANVIFLVQDFTRT